MTDPVSAGAGAKPGPGEPCVLLKQGEIFLKGRHRQQFERMLHANVRAAVRTTGVPAELISVLAGQDAPLALGDIEGMLNGAVELELRHGGQAAYWWLLAAE